MADQAAAACGSTKRQLMQTRTVHSFPQQINPSTMKKLTAIETATINGGPGSGAGGVWLN